MRHFYRDLLGFTYAGFLSFNGFSIEAYRFGNSTLKLTLPPEGMSPSPHEPEFKNGYITVRVNDAEAIFKEAEKNGVQVSFPLQAMELEGGGKGKTGFLVDPMGNLVELVELQEGKLHWD